jgi:hypothetical protein
MLLEIFMGLTFVHAKAVLMNRKETDTMGDSQGIEYSVVITFSSIGTAMFAVVSLSCELRDEKQTIPPRSKF